MNLPKKTTLSEKMYETTIEEDMHFLTEVVDGLTEDDVNEIMTNASGWESVPDITSKNLHFGEVGNQLGSGTRPVDFGSNLCNDTIMNKTNLFSTSNLTDLQDFMFDTMLPADDCVDWFCDRHDVNATDEVIDFVVDAHFAFHGE